MLDGKGEAIEAWQQTRYTLQQSRNRAVTREINLVLWGPNACGHIANLNFLNLAALSNFLSDCVM